MLTCGQPSEVGMSTEKLEAGVQRFEEAIARDDLQGVVLLVARDSKIVLHRAMGWRNKEKKMPMEHDTLIRTASNAKPIIVAAVQLLSEEQKISLDDAIGKHLPAFANEKCRGMTVRRLLNHTSGLRIPGLFLEPMLQRSPEHPDAPSLQIEVNRFAEIGPEEEPGNACHYSNAGYNILAALIEVCSGLSLEEFLTRRIYQPLGMVDATHHTTENMVDRMSVVYERDGGEWKVRFRQEDPPRAPFARGSGGTICTTLDYARFCQMLLNGGTYGATRLLSEEAVREATSGQFRSAGAGGFDTFEEYETQTAYHGFTWHISSRGAYTCGGSDGTFAWVDPQDQVIGLVFTQSSYQAIQGRDGLNVRFMDAVDAACNG